MDILEKAKKYAEGKAIEAITLAIEEAYVNGYKAGWSDSELAAKNIICDGIEYVDLNLPTGTKWSVGYIKDDSGKYQYFSYDEAVKLNIPTKQQYEELLEYTQRIAKDTYSLKGTDFLGRNGEVLFLPDAQFYMASHKSPVGTFLFWLKDDECDGDARLCAYNSQTEKRYMGYKLPVLLVK
ncbi:hypothetical protein [Prevotella sp. MA2016]|uniref:hypothetical protein n=1 Tax=Prevotella sp. MA2016 TaxID=1408310 RepID=UPI00048E4AAF|nr:hypothetical protein [Prevotella sp. MA2016]